MNPAQVPRRPFALLVTHAALGSELLRTVEGILGAQSDVQVLSNDGYSSDALSRAIEERVRDVPGDRPVVLFTDLAAGSCGIASRRARSRGPLPFRLAGGRARRGTLDFRGAPSFDARDHRGGAGVLAVSRTRGAASAQRGRVPAP